MPESPAPVILAVDDDRTALANTQRELRERYGVHYHVFCTDSPAEARALLTKLAEAGKEVALTLAAQWLQGTTGSALLEHVRRLHPHAKRGLLIPWGGWGDQATAEAIFDAMALGRIDYYVLKPAAPWEVESLIDRFIDFYNNPCPQSPREPSYERVVQDRRGGSIYNMSQSSGELLALVVNVPRRSLGPSVLA